jgi:hypothetical protein
MILPGPGPPLSELPPQTPLVTAEPQDVRQPTPPTETPLKPSARLTTNDFAERDRELDAMLEAKMAEINEWAENFQILEEDISKRLRFAEAREKDLLDFEKGLDCREANINAEELRAAKKCHRILETIDVTGRIGTGRAVRNREYQLDETRLGKEQIVNLSITYCKTIVN